MIWWALIRKRNLIDQFRLRNYTTQLTRETKSLFPKNLKTKWVWALNNRIMQLSQVCKCFSSIGILTRPAMSRKRRKLSSRRSSWGSNRSQSEGVLAPNRLSILMLRVRLFKDNGGFQIVWQMGGKYLLIVLSGQLQRFIKVH
jgi:hypothetical protein